MFGRPGFNTQLMLMVICRVKNHLGYPECLPGGKDIHPQVVSLGVVGHGVGFHGRGTVLRWSVQNLIVYAVL
jgi:hypothetical protein